MGGNAFIISYYLVIGLIAAAWVWHDSRKLGLSLNNTLLWLVGSLLAPLVVLPLYLVFGRRQKPAPVPRDSEKTAIDVEATVIDEPKVFCPMCASRVPGSSARCPHCDFAVRPSCSRCGGELSREWRSCPQCGTPVEGK